MRSAETLHHLQMHAPHYVSGDGINNVLDVVSLVNCVLGDGCDICAGDMNQDGVLNVLDVVLLVNSILG